MILRLRPLIRSLRAYGRIWVFLAAAIVLIVVMGMLLARSLDTLNSGASWVAHSERVSFALAQVLQSLSDTGAGVTEYDVTHDPRVFERAIAATASVPGELSALQQLLADEPIERSLMARLRELAAQRIAQTQEQRERALRRDVAGVLGGISSGESRHTMDPLRELVDQMQSTEGRIRAVHADEARRARDLLAYGIEATAAIAILLLITIAVVTVRHADRLRSIQEELATTLRSVGDAVIATDAAGAVRFINESAEYLTGCSSAAARGLPLEQVFCAFDEHTRAAAESPTARVLRERQPIRVSPELILRARDGTERPIEVSAAPIVGHDGGISGAVLIFRDATDERAARRALIETSDALREADQRKDVFLATLSHELRNPLAPIRTAARVLETPGVSPLDLERSRRIIARQVHHMAALLDDLLDISRISRGVLTLKCEIVDLGGILDAAVETAQPLVARKRQVLEIEGPDATIFLEVDPVRLTQVVANLLTNAAKYTDPGGRISLGVHRDAQALVITVRDTGKGIAPQMLPRVFEMFTRLESDRDHSDGGLGIGLALVKGFVELHGGRVEARSEGVARGSEFRIVLPGSLVRPAGSGDDAARLRAQPQPRAQRVLVADDNQDAAASLAMLLELSGHQVRVAHNGRDALEIAAAHRPDVVVLDIAMPDLSGYDVAARIRGEPWGVGMRLIAVTGWGQEGDRRRAQAAGFDHHLTKPVDPSKLEGLLADGRRA